MTVSKITLKFEDCTPYQAGMLALLLELLKLRHQESETTLADCSPLMLEGCLHLMDELFALLWEVIDFEVHPRSGLTSLEEMELKYLDVLHDVGRQFQRGRRWEWQSPADAD